jgi:hypothetical protein
LARNSAARFLSYGLLVAISACGIWAQQLTVASEGEAPAAAVLPRRTAEMTPNPPRVSCKGDQLTITADNSTLGSVLAGVHACLGVEIEIPNGSSDERTYLQLGPGPTHEVLDALLSSTEFNYVIQSSNSGSGKILAILLTVRTKDTNEGLDSRGTSLAANLTMTPARRAWIASRNAGRPAGTPTDDEESPSVESEPVAPVAPEQALPPQADSKAAVLGAAVTDLGERSKENESPARAAAPSGPEPAVASDAVPAPSDPRSGSPAAKELQNKINQMQQLFEERKKMIANPSASPNQN